MVLVAQLSSASSSSKIVAQKFGVVRVDGEGAAATGEKRPMGGKKEEEDAPNGSYVSKARAEDDLRVDEAMV